MCIYKDIKLVDLDESIVNLRVPSSGFFVEYQVGRDLKDHLATTWVRRAFEEELPCLHHKLCPKKATREKKKSLFLLPQHIQIYPWPWVTSQAGSVSSAWCLGRAWMQQVNLARQRWAGHSWGGFANPWFWWLHCCELGRCGIELIAWQ